MLKRTGAALALGTSLIGLSGAVAGKKPSGSTALSGTVPLIRSASSRVLVLRRAVCRHILADQGRTRSVPRPRSGALCSPEPFSLGHDPVATKLFPAQVADRR